MRVLVIKFRKKDGAMISTVIKHFLYDYAIKNTFEHVIHNFTERSKQLKPGSRYSYIKLESLLFPSDYWTYEGIEYYDVTIIYSFGSFLMVSANKKVLTRRITVQNADLYHIETVSRGISEVRTYSSDGRFDTVKAIELDSSSDSSIIDAANPYAIIDSIQLSSTKIVDIK